ncbi:hypothetical protein CEK25_009363 [Fusarium fujikuroi]|nr:hypothetical protein CEK25_009363 [Fusarium fujikuroi]
MGGGFMSKGGWGYLLDRASTDVLQIAVATKRTCIGYIGPMMIEAGGYGLDLACTDLWCREEVAMKRACGTKEILRGASLITIFLIWASHGCSGSIS